MTINEILLILAIGFIAGIASGSFGIGGGIIIVPALVFIIGFEIHKAQGTSLAMMLAPIMALAVWNYHRSGNVDFRVAGIMIVAFVIGSYLGSKYAILLPANVLRKSFGILMLLVALKLILSK